MSSTPPPSSRRPDPVPPAPRGRSAARGVAVGGAIALAAWGAAGALASDRPAQVGMMAAAGTIRLDSPQNGTAILTAAGMLPGTSASGTVTLKNNGDTAGDLQLDRTAVHDALGIGGGRLSDALQMRLDDITGPTLKTVFSGTLDRFDDLDLGKLGAGEQRSYRVTALLPDRGLPSGPVSGDNALQGASTQIDWIWHAEPLPTPTPSPGQPTTPPPPHTTPPVTTPRPTGTPIPLKSPPGGSAAASVLTLRIPWQRVMTTRGITVTASCDRKCRLSFTAVVQTAPRHGRAKVLMRGKVFRVKGTKRRLRPGHSHRIKLHLTPRAVARMHAALLQRGRVAVLVKARVKSSLGAATVKRRIILTTSNRAARHRAAQR